jgi:hypothetical protein
VTLAIRVLRFVPRALTAVTMTTAISEATRAYSMAVAPPRSLRNRAMKLDRETSSHAGAAASPTPGRGSRTPEDNQAR